MAAGKRLQGETLVQYRERLQEVQARIDFSASHGSNPLFSSSGGTTAAAVHDENGRTLGYKKFTPPQNSRHRYLPPRKSRKGNLISGSLPRLSGY